MNGYVFKKGRLIFGVAVSCLFFTGLSGCADGYTVIRPDDSPAPIPMPAAQIYFYPSRGQTAEQQDRDHYECNLWAINASGFDPAQAQLAPHQRVKVVPASPPGSGAAAGAAGGAIAGSILSRRGDRGEGMVFGAITGALLGAAADEASSNEAKRIEDQANSAQYAKLEQQSRNYRRAITACLEGRGYTVR